MDWWENYLTSEQFRLNEEIVAHRAEYGTYCSLNKDRNRRLLYLNEIAQRLAGPIYGNAMTVSRARGLIAR